MDLHGKRIALLVAPMFRDEEVFEPIDELSARGADVVVLGLTRGLVRGKLGGTISPDRLVQSALPRDFDALILPGGQAPEVLRLDADVLAFVRECDKRHMPIAAICHGPQVLISAGLLAGRRATCFKGIKDDLVLAGARYEDAAVVVDGNLVTSREPGDVPAFIDALADLLVGRPAVAPHAVHAAHRG